MRWASLGVALALAAVLVGASLAGWRAAREAGTSLTQGQAEILVETLHRTLRQGPPDDEDLLEVLEAHSAFGLRYVGIVDRGRVVASAGEPSGSPGSGARWERVQGPEGPRIRVSRRLPPPGPRRGPPRGPEGEEPERRSPPGKRRPPERLGDRDGRRGPPPPPPPWDGGRDRDHDRRGPPHELVIEIEPVLAHHLMSRADRTLGVSLVAAVVLAAAALVLGRLASRARLAEESLERQRHLAALGEMSAVLAHEIRNPLASLKGHAQLFAESAEPGPDRERADRIVSEAVRLERLTGGLLDFVRSGRIERVPASPRDLLERAVHGIEPGRLAIDAESAPERWSLDPDRVQQVLTNLVTNALQASPDGERVEAAVSMDRGSLVYTIRDRGPGIPAGDEERIFDAFHTTRTRGTGLGLAVAKRIVEAHGGTIEVANATGGGARFRIAIPE